MNTNHYPDLERCKKLTEIGFPETEKAWRTYVISEPSITCPQYDGNPEYFCPSVMEMLDVIPKFHEDLGWLVIKPMASGWSVGYDEHNAEILGELPNALADLIFWLHENNYIKF